MSKCMINEYLNKGPDCLLVTSANILLALRVTKSGLNAPHDRTQVVTEIQNQ